MYIRITQSYHIALSPSAHLCKFFPTFLLLCNPVISYIACEVLKSMEDVNSQVSWQFHIFKQISIKRFIVFTIIKKNKVKAWQSTPFVMTAKITAKSRS